MRPVFNGCDTGWSAPQEFMTTLHLLRLSGHGEDWLWYDYMELNWQGCWVDRKANRSFQMRWSPLSPCFWVDEDGSCCEDGEESSQMAGLNSCSTSQTMKLVLGSKIQVSERGFIAKMSRWGFYEELFDT